MKIDTGKMSYEATWEEYEPGVKVKVRPYPASMGGITLKDGAIQLTNDERFRVFDYSAEAWDGITGGDDNPLPCTSEVKKIIFDFEMDVDLIRFVTDKAIEKRKAKGDSLKN